jgi:branched-chain amino acid transport system permease protein
MVGERERWLLRFGTLVVVLAALLLGANGAHAQSGADGGVKGKLQYTPAAGGAKVPVPGAVVIVYAAELSSDGRTVVSVADEIGRATSGADGSFLIPLQTPGSYAVEIDATSLPDGIELKNPDRARLPLRLTARETKSVLFPMIESGAATGGSAGSTTETSTTAPARPGSSAWDSAARLAVGGLQFGLIIGLCAVGLSLIYATTGLVNFAISEMITLGAVLTWWLNVSLGIQLIAAIPLSMALGGLVGATMDIGLWRPLRRRGTGLVAMMIISIGLAIAMRYSILYVFGDRRKPYGDYAVQTKVLFTVGPVSLIPKDVIIMVVSAALLIGVGLLLRFTKLGKAMRAIADSPDLASSTGIDVNRVITIVWFLAGTLVTLGATFLALSEQVQWLLGNQLLLLVFAAVTLGGLGTTYGAMVGSIVVGVLINVAPVWVPPGLDDPLIPAEMKNVGALLVMIIVLMIRPQGIFGRRERVG